MKLTKFSIFALATAMTTAIGFSTAHAETLSDVKQCRIITGGVTYGYVEPQKIHTDTGEPLKLQLSPIGLQFNSKIYVPVAKPALVFTSYPKKEVVYVRKNNYKLMCLNIDPDLNHAKD